MNIVLTNKMTPRYWCGCGSRSRVWSDSKIRIVSGCQSRTGSRSASWYGTKFGSRTMEWVWCRSRFT